MDCRSTDGNRPFECLLLAEFFRSVEEIDRELSHIVRIVIAGHSRMTAERCRYGISIGTTGTGRTAGTLRERNINITSISPAIALTPPVKRHSSISLYDRFAPPESISFNHLLIEFNVKCNLGVILPVPVLSSANSRSITVFCYAAAYRLPPRSFGAMTAASVTTF